MLRIREVDREREREKERDRERGGGRDYHDFPSKNWLSHSTLCVFRKFLVSKNFMNKRGGGGITIFPSKNFCPAMPKNSVAEHFSVSLIWGIEKLYA